MWLLLLWNVGHDTPSASLSSRARAAPLGPVPVSWPARSQPWATAQHDEAVRADGSGLALLLGATCHRAEGSHGTVWIAPTRSAVQPMPQISRRTPLPVGSQVLASTFVSQGPPFGLGKLGP